MRYDYDLFSDGPKSDFRTGRHLFPSEQYQKKVYKYQKWETYGYLDYVTYADYLNALKAKGEIDEDTRSKAVAFGRTKDRIQNWYLNM